MMKTSEIKDRATQKLVEHLQDALIHLDNSTLPEAVKKELDGLLQQAGGVIAGAYRSTTMGVRS